MGSNAWQRHKLGEIVDDIAMGPFGSNLKVDNFISEGVPVIRGGNLNEDGFEDKNFVFVSEEKANSLKRSLAYPDDLVFTHRGTIGQVGIIPHDKYPKYLVSQSQMRLTVSKKYLEPKFLYYFFKSPFGQYELLKNSSQVGVPAIASPTRALKEVEIYLPSLPTQRRIADILSALDEKIELNCQTNATLEAIAQSIFREWFVDGEDIDDWEVGKLGDIAENIRRSVQPSEIEPDTPYIGLEHMPRGSIALSEWDTASDVVSNKYQFKQNEFLFGKLRPYFHKVGVAPLDGVSSTDILVVAPKEDDYYGVVLGHISSVDLINHTTAASTGTKMPRTNWSDIARYEIALPPKERAKQFSVFMKSVVQLIRSNIMETRTLANIRDALLPKLMSGEIEV